MIWFGSLGTFPVFFAIGRNPGLAKKQNSFHIAVPSLQLQMTGVKTGSGWHSG